MDQGFDGTDRPTEAATELAAEPAEANTLPPAPDAATDAAIDAATDEESKYPNYTHKQIMRILWGLLLASFTTNMAGTIVSNALPTITARLGSTQQEYMWIVTATLLASTASTPIWGKLADLFNKKTLELAGLTVFIVGSLLAGFSPNTGFLIAFRAIQGIGLGAMLALTQAILGSIIAPKDRGKYMAYTGGTIAVATIIAPLLGGFVVDAPFLGWRWCFWITVPLALAARVMIKLTLNVPFFPRPNKIDWGGAALVTTAACSLLVWISFADHQFAYLSWQTFALLSLCLLAAVAFVIVESKASNPIIPLAIISTRTTALAIVASIGVGLGMFGVSVYLGQYYQLSRGFTPTEAGLLTIPMMIGNLFSSILIGRRVSDTGSWKPFVNIGFVVTILGFACMISVDHTTPIWLTSLYGAVIGVGLGATMMNLVLAVQNIVSVHDIGAASASVTFFRNLGGAVGVQVLGVVYTRQMANLLENSLEANHIPLSVLGAQAGAEMSMNLGQLPANVRPLVAAAYGDAISPLFLIATILTVCSAIAAWFIPATRLRGTFNTQASVDRGRGK
ncbi:MAG: MFS transporter [Propionibacteriaceae bacterium]|nr:MFS transporter [Propionibacteriaceae bacterium]